MKDALMGILFTLAGVALLFSLLGGLLHFIEVAIWTYHDDTGEIAREL